MTDIVLDVMVDVVNANCAYQMAGCFVPCVGHVWRIQLIILQVKEDSLRL